VRPAVRPGCAGLSRKFESRHRLASGRLAAGARIDAQQAFVQIEDRAEQGHALVLAGAIAPDRQLAVALVPEHREHRSRVGRGRGRNERFAASLAREARGKAGLLDVEVQVWFAWKCACVISRTSMRSGAISTFSIRRSRRDAMV